MTITGTWLPLDLRRNWPALEVITRLVALATGTVHRVTGIRRDLPGMAPCAGPDGVAGLRRSFPFEYRAPWTAAAWFVIPATLLATNLLAVLPAARAATLRVADVLRAE